MLRSLAFPGWGQLENAQPAKAALVMAVEGGLFASAVVEFRRSDRAFEAHIAAANRGDADEADRLYQLYEDRRTRATGRFWWAAFAIMISALDAYVDAYLRDFDVEPAIDIDLPAPPTERPGQAPAGVSLELDVGVDAQGGGTLGVRMAF